MEKNEPIKTTQAEILIIGEGAAGDVTCGGMQVVSAAGEGCVAAMQAVKYLRHRNKD